MRSLAFVTVVLAFSTLVIAAQSPANKPKVSRAKAETVVRQRVPGTIQNEDVLNDGHFSFDIQTKQGELRNVIVDSETGKILSNKPEQTAELDAKKKKKKFSKISTKVSGATKRSGATKQQ